MIIIQQDNRLTEIDNLLSKYGNTTLELNKQIIIEDIERITKRTKSIKDIILPTKNAENHQNGIVKYLEKLIEKSEKGLITIGWGLDGKLIKSYPIEMVVIPEFKISSVDYINLKNEHVVYLDYTELVNILAFELMYRDIGETHDSIEEKLHDIGIVGVYDSSVLTKCFSEKIYELSKVLYISDSPYMVPNSGKITDYFGSMEFDTTSYKEVVSYSCKSAMTFIIEALLKKCSDNNLKFKICGVFDTGIHLLVTDPLDASTREQLTETVCIRTFGRKLEVKPKVQVF